MLKRPFQVRVRPRAMFAMFAGQRFAIPPFTNTLVNKFMFPQPFSCDQIVVERRLTSDTFNSQHTNNRNLGSSREKESS